MLKVIGSSQKMAVFNRDVAAEHGLEFAVVFQELLRDMDTRSPKDLEHGVLCDEQRTWYRFDDGDLLKLFPYIELQEVKEIICRVEKLDQIICWRSTETSVLWITIKAL